MKLILLSEDFYSKYSKYPEILKKTKRPYVCLEVNVDGVRFAIPFRHHITHKYALITGDGGLDYTKAVVVSDLKMVSDVTPQVDQKEFNYIKTRERHIEAGIRRYYLLVKNAMQYPNSPRYKNILKYSALKYFVN